MACAREYRCDLTEKVFFVENNPVAVFASASHSPFSTSKRRRWKPSDARAASAKSPPARSSPS